MTPVPPFRMLDPALKAAEILLAQGEFAEVVAALPDERAAAERLNAVLHGVRLSQQDGLWRAEFDEAGVAGIVALVVTDGWRRIKRCELCGGAFVDRTNGCSRRRCAVHRRVSGWA